MNVEFTLLDFAAIIGARWACAQLSSHAAALEEADVESLVAVQVNGAALDGLFERMRTAAHVAGAGVEAEAILAAVERAT